jgi:hypothetical protein
MSLGDAYIDVHANDEPFRRDLEHDIPRIGAEADDLMEKIGEGWGKHLSEGTRSELRKQMPDVVREFERGAKAVKIRIGKDNFLLDRRGEVRDVAGRFVSMFTEEAARAFERAGRPGGPLSKVGEGFTDAIGAMFNVSGKSPLVLGLVFVFGAIAEAIAAAVQAVNALIAVLVQVPGLLVAIGLQAGVLMLAFNGVGTAISGAFAAKNWNEFYAAIQNLTPAAKNFVITLLPIRDLFRELKTSVQESFFRAFGNAMVNVAHQLGPILRSGLPELANALGGLFSQITLFFASPVFVKFVTDIIPATVRWLGNFGPGFVSLLTAVFRMADAAIPALERLGQIVTNSFGMFTSWLTEQIQTGNLTDWLDDMSRTLQNVVELFFSASQFVAAFLDALNNNGGDDAIKQISEFFLQLAMFFGSPAGQAAMAGFIHLVELLTFSFSGLVFAILGLLIAFESVLQFFGFIGAEFMKFIDWLTDTAGPAIGKFFTETLPGFFSDLWEKVTELWDKIVYYIQTAWGLAVNFVKDTWNDFIGWISKKVDDFVGFFTGLPDRLAQIGRDIMHGLWQGLQDGWNNTVKPILDWITKQIPDWKGPKAKDLKLLQPAGEAVMEGFGKGLEAGAMDVKGMLGEFTRSIALGGVVAQNTFNTNLNFNGAAPTESQARAAGRAASGELNDQVASTNIRLAYRVA